MRPTPGWPRAVLVESMVGQGQEVQPIDLRSRRYITVVGSISVPSLLSVSPCAGWSTADPGVRVVAPTSARRRL